MAIARGAGTEIIRSAYFEDIDNTSAPGQRLIIGEQHHIYTVLSIWIMCAAVQSVGNQIQVFLRGYDANAGDTAQDHKIFRWRGVDNDTFVWNDKFSFNGHEPINFTGPMDNTTKQNAIADQGSDVAQFIHCVTTHADDQYEVGITYIDQNNA